MRGHTATERKQKVQTIKYDPKSKAVISLGKQGGYSWEQYKNQAWAMQVLLFSIKTSAV
jgi:hypothetical protein